MLIMADQYKYTNPKSPVYIISKGRHDTMYTSRSLSRMRVPHYIAIEPQDEELYDKATEEQYGSLIIDCSHKDKRFMKGLDTELIIK